MKLASRKKIYSTGGKSVESNPQDLSNWKILLVDDDPDKILLKPGKLTDDEFSIMQQHTVIGAAILGNMHAMELAQDIALSHHEHWDGSGYPEGRIADQTSLPARIVGISDVFDALINIRCYKSAWTIDEAITYIKDKSGTQFDPKVTEAFLKLYDQGVIEKLILESKA